MEDGASSSSSASASSSSSSSEAAAGAGAARELLREGRDDRLGMVSLYSLLTERRAAREFRRVNIQQLNVLQQQLHAQLEDSAAVGEMAMHPIAEVRDPVDLLFDIPSSSRSAEFDAAQDPQRSEIPSWFESSVEHLLRAIQPSRLAGGGRASLETNGQGSDTSSNYKRHKVLGFSIHGQKSCPGMSQASSNTGQLQGRGQQRDFAPSLPPMDQDSGNMEEGGFPNGSGGEDNNAGGGMENDPPSMYLTDDLLHMVLSFLDQRSLCEAAMVCRQWRIASEHEDFWKSLDFGSKITREQVGSLCRRFPKAVDLSFTNVNMVDEVAKEAMHSLRCLETLSVCKGSLSDSFFTALASGCPALQNLVIVDAVLGSGGSQEFQIRHKTLSRLQVTECRVMRMVIRCPLLQKLFLKQTNMASATLYCPRLLSLDVSSCPKLSDAGVRGAATSCHSLLALNISQCSYVSDETLREICIACLNLHVLDASWCPNISLQGVRMPMLRELRLNNCEGINSSSMAALSQCFTLETICLDSCVLLTAVMLNLQRLHRISLANCCKLVVLTLRCPALVNINVEACFMLTRIEISSLALKKLVLQKQPSLTTLSLECPHLHVVNLVECDSLANSICEVFSDGGGCPRLNSLTLESCEGLTELNLSSTTLSVLSLAGCHKLHRIDLACANLQQLILDGCQLLSIVSLAPVGLQSLNLGICPHVTELKIEASSMVSVDLKGCGALFKANINCPQLLSLDASYCSELDDECLEAATTACPLMQSLILACCPLIGPAGLLTLKKLCNLTTLDLSYTFLTDLTPIFKSCVRLKVLRLLACKYLVDSALDALHCKETLPDLRELDLSYGGLGHAALRRLLSQCSHLTHVSLNGCAKLSDLEWEVIGTEKACLLQTTKHWCQESQTHNDVFKRTSTGCKLDGAEHSSELTEADFVELGIRAEEQKMASPRALQQLNCVCCPNIKRVVILDAAGFHDLSSLNFSLSSNIKEAQLECPYLITLNLSHCTALEELRMKCPRLVSLSLQASNIEASALESVVQGCSALETLDIRNCAKISAEDLACVRAACPRLKRLLSTVSA